MAQTLALSYPVLWTARVCLTCPHSHGTYIQALTSTLHAAAKGALVAPSGPAQPHSDLETRVDSTSPSSVGACFFQEERQSVQYIGRLNPVFCAVATQPP